MKHFKVHTAKETKNGVKDETSKDIIHILGNRKI